MKMSKLFGVMALVLAMSGQAQALVMDFSQPVADLNGNVIADGDWLSPGSYDGDGDAFGYAWSEMLLQDKTAYHQGDFADDLETVVGFASIVGLTSPFNLNNVTFAFAELPMTVRVEGWLAGNWVKGNTFDVPLLGIGLVSQNFSFTGIDEVRFSLVDTPVEETNYGFGIASISVTPVPESNTYAMMLAGLGILGLVVRRKTVLH